MVSRRCQASLLARNLIKETLQVDSFYQNVRLFRSQQFRVNCENGIAGKSYNGFPSSLLVAGLSLLNGVMVIGEWEPGVLPATHTVKNGIRALVDVTCSEVQR